MEFLLEYLDMPGAILKTGLPRSVIKVHTKNGNLPSYKLGSKTVYRKIDVLDFRDQYLLGWFSKRGPKVGSKRGPKK